MAKKRVTLPKDFNELLTDGNIDQLKAVYDKCELTAHDGRYSLSTALHFGGVPDELVIWLVEEGLDINTPDYYGAFVSSGNHGKRYCKTIARIGCRH